MRTAVKGRALIACASALLWVSAAAATDFQFGLSQTISTTTTRPIGTFVGDLDGDGDLDLAHTNYTSAFVSVYFNDGTGALGAPTLLPVALIGGSGIDGADFDGDGDIDLAYCLFGPSAGNGRVQIMLNNGNGTFATPQDLLSTDRPTSLKVVDMNLDTHADVVAVTANSASVHIFHGDGAGSFSVDQVVGGTWGASGFVAEDLNGDTYPDLAVSTRNDQNVKIYLTSGGTALTQTAQHPMGAYANRIASIDLEGDGDLDLVTVTEQTKKVVKLTNDGAGIFTAADLIDLSPLPVTDGPGRPIVADFDLDGHLDLQVYTGDLVFFKGDGTGNFVQDITLDAGTREIVTAPADMNQDGLLDIPVVNDILSGTGELRVYFNETITLASLFEDWEDGDALGWQISGATANLVPGNLDGTGTQLLHLSRTGVDQPLPAIYYDDPASINWSNYSLEADIRFDATDGLGKGVLIFGNQNPGLLDNTYYAIIAANGGGNMRLYKVVGGVTTELDVLFAPVAENAIYRMRVDFAQGDIRFYLDGEQKLSSTDATFASGGVGVGTKHGGGGSISINTDIDNIQVRPLLPVSLPDLASSYAAPIDIPVQLGAVAGLGVVASELFVTYDGDLLTPTASPVSPTVLTSAWSIEHNVVDGVGTSIDTLKIALADEVALAGSGDLLTLHFAVADVRVPSSSVLGLVNALFNDGTPQAAATAGSVTVVGTDAQGSTDVVEIIPRESIAVTIIDPDEDLDGAGSTDQVSVAVSNGLQSETLTLLETSTPGEFAGSISTVFDAASTAAAQSGDNTVQAKAGDQIVFTFVDQLLSDGGGPVDLVLLVNAIGGTDGTVEITQVTQPGDVVYLKVVDADLNGDDQTIETAQVVVTSSNGETETVTLTEMDADDEVFFGRLSSALGGVAGTDDDGTMVGAKGDVLTVTYDDVVTVLGDQLDRIATDQVVDPFGDADGNGNVQAFDAAQVLLHVLSPFITGLELLQANVDTDPSGTGITPFDASLILQKRVGLITSFPVQDSLSTNHPQKVPSSPKLMVTSRQLSLVYGENYVSVVADAREDIVSGDVLLKGVSGQVVLPEDLGDFLTASRATEEGLRIAFAGAEAVSGPGELLRVYGVGPEPARLVRASFNDGWIEAQIGASPMPMPATYALEGNAPNPFNPETVIGFSLPQAGRVELVVYDALGQRVRELVSSHWSAGVHSTTWDGRSDAGAQVSSGVYFYRLRAGDFVQTRRMMLIK